MPTSSPVPVLHVDKGTELRSTGEELLLRRRDAELRIPLAAIARVHAQRAPPRGGVARTGRGHANRVPRRRRQRGRRLRLRRRGERRPAPARCGRGAQIGAALGIAIASSVAFAQSTGTNAEGLNDGFQAGFLATAVFALTGLVTALLLLLNRDSGRPKVVESNADTATEAPAQRVTAGH